MKELNHLFSHIVRRVNIALRNIPFDVNPFADQLIPAEQMSKFYAFYGITTDHPLDLQFSGSALAGSYFLGKCKVTNSLLYKSDIRGDELKRKGDVLHIEDAGEFELVLKHDEKIDISNSVLIKTLVHNFSHDPESLEDFFIRNTMSMDYANIHGSPADGCLLGPFATVDLTTMRNSVIGSYSYLQTSGISSLDVRPGTIWVEKPQQFNFLYTYPQEELKYYISLSPDKVPWGLFVDFIEERKKNFQRIFDFVNMEEMSSVPDTASLDRYAVVMPKTEIADNVLISQRAYLENSIMGKGANTQENSFIINSVMEGCDVAAHGAKLVYTTLEPNIFVGFNCFIYGKEHAKITIGRDSIVMPHTIIDCDEPLDVPPHTLVWGLIRNQDELVNNSVDLDEFTTIQSSFSKGRMFFEGNGGAFVKAFKDRIHHILEVNGAFYDNGKCAGHAQRNQNLALNTIQPFQFGDMEGMYPSIKIGL